MWRLLARGAGLQVRDVALRARLHDRKHALVHHRHQRADLAEGGGMRPALRNRSRRMPAKELQSGVAKRR